MLVANGNQETVNEVYRLLLLYTSACRQDLVSTHEMLVTNDYAFIKIRAKAIDNKLNSSKSFLSTVCRNGTLEKSRILDR